MQAVILAGGLGTRLRPLTNTIPKAMVLVKRRPFLEYEIELLKMSGFDDVVLCVGYLGEIIENHFGNGFAFGLKIRYSYDGSSALGPGGALKKAEPLLDDYFFVSYGDAYLRLDYHDLFEAFLKSGKLGMMVAYENHNRFGKSDLLIDKGLVVKYDKNNQSADMIWINYGVVILDKRALKDVPLDVELDEEQFYGNLIRRNELASYIAKERFYEIGTMESLAEFESFVSAKNEKAM